MKNAILEMRDKLAGLETEARKLQNQNFADIVASAKGKLHQLTEHPDLDLIGKDTEAQREVRARQEEMPFDPKASETSRHTLPGSDFPDQQNFAGTPNIDPLQPVHNDGYVLRPESAADVLPPATGL